MSGQRLVIIESAHKQKTVQSLLENSGIRATVIATNGHICELTDDFEAPVFDGRRIRNYRIRSGNEDTVNMIRAQAMRTAAIYIMTDPDFEGERIANDVFTILTKDMPGMASMIYRPYVVHMITDEIVRGFQNAPLAADVVPERSAPSYARRIIDRIIPQAFNSKAAHDKSVGRVQGGIMQAWAGRDTVKPRPYRLSHHGHGGWISDHVFTSEEAAANHRLLFEDIEAGGFDLQHESVYEPYGERFRPMNAWDATIEAVEQGCMNAKTATNAMQEEFAAGHLSYPRTNSRAVVAGEQAYRDLLRAHGVQTPLYGTGGDDDGMAHEALVAWRPVRANGPVVIPGQARESVNRIITQHMLLSGDPRMVNRDYRWVQASDIPDSEPVLQIREHSPPRSLFQRNERIEGVSLRSKDAWLVELYRDTGLAEPSTIGAHVQKSVSMVEPDGGLSRDGKAYLALLESRSPFLLEPGFHEQLNTILFDGRDPFVRRINHALDWIEQHTDFRYERETPENVDMINAPDLER